MVTRVMLWLASIMCLWQLEGIWHTGVVVAGIEYYFGGGVQRARAGRTQFGQPSQVIDIGWVLGATVEAWHSKWQPFVVDAHSWEVLQDVWFEMMLNARHSRNTHYFIVLLAGSTCTSVVVLLRVSSSHSILCDFVLSWSHLLCWFLQDFSSTVFHNDSTILFTKISVVQVHVSVYIF